MAKKILIAEDDKFLSNAYRVKFTNAGYETKLASNGQEALDILNSFIPEVIIVDLMMPVMDGFELLKQLKSNPKTKDIPAIVTSNLGQPEDKEKSVALGAVFFLIKSDTPISKIVEEVEKAISIPQKGRV